MDAGLKWRLALDYNVVVSFSSPSSRFMHRKPEYMIYNP